MKFKPNGKIDRYKACLVAKGFTQTFGVDYAEIFSSVARLNSIRVLLSISINQAWDVYQLDVKNVFLYVDLIEQVFMEQSLRYIAQGESIVCCL